jgi:hypothetical protein
LGKSLEAEAHSFERRASVELIQEEKAEETWIHGILDFLRRAKVETDQPHRIVERLIDLLAATAAHRNNGIARLVYSEIIRDGSEWLPRFLHVLLGPYTQGQLVARILAERWSGNDPSREELRAIASLAKSRRAVLLEGINREIRFLEYRDPDSAAENADAAEGRQRKISQLEWLRGRLQVIFSSDLSASFVLIVTGSALLTALSAFSGSDVLQAGGVGLTPILLSRRKFLGLGTVAADGTQQERKGSDAFRRFAKAFNQTFIFSAVLWLHSHALYETWQNFQSSRNPHIHRTLEPYEHAYLRGRLHGLLQDCLVSSNGLQIASSTLQLKEFLHENRVELRIKYRANRAISRRIRDLETLLERYRIGEWNDPLDNAARHLYRLLEAPAVDDRQSEPVSHQEGSGKMILTILLALAAGLLSLSSDAALAGVGWATVFMLPNLPKEPGERRTDMVKAAINYVLGKKLSATWRQRGEPEPKEVALARLDRAVQRVLEESHAHLTADERNYVKRILARLTVWDAPNERIAHIQRKEGTPLPLRRAGLSHVIRTSVVLAAAVLFGWAPPSGAQTVAEDITFSITDLAPKGKNATYRPDFAKTESLILRGGTLSAEVRATPVSPLADKSFEILGFADTDVGSAYYDPQRITLESEYPFAGLTPETFSLGHLSTSSPDALAYIRNYLKQTSLESYREELERGTILHEAAHYWRVRYGPSLAGLTETARSRELEHAGYLADAASSRDPRWTLILMASVRTVGVKTSHNDAINDAMEDVVRGLSERLKSPEWLSSFKGVDGDWVPARIADLVGAIYRAKVDLDVLRDILWDAYEVRHGVAPRSHHFDGRAEAAGAPWASVLLMAGTSLISLLAFGLLGVVRLGDAEPTAPTSAQLLDLLAHWGVSRNPATQLLIDGLKQVIRTQTELEIVRELWNPDIPELVLPEKELFQILQRAKSFRRFHSEYRELIFKVTGTRSSARSKGRTSISANFLTSAAQVADLVGAGLIFLEPEMMPRLEMVRRAAMKVVADARGRASITLAPMRTINFRNLQPGNTYVIHPYLEPQGLFFYLVQPDHSTYVFSAIAPWRSSKDSDRRDVYRPRFWAVLPTLLEARSWVLAQPGERFLAPLSRRKPSTLTGWMIPFVMTLFSFLTERDEPRKPLPSPNLLASA